MISNIEKLAFYIPNTLIKINDISGLFSGFQDNPETAFNDGFYSEVIEKKKELTADAAINSANKSLILHFINKSTSFH